ncbi:MAG: type III pantothenate kinase [Crocinitomicaceae bacterium]
MEINAYLLDAGNTQVKLATVKNGVISDVNRFDMNNFPWDSLDRNIPIVISSVLSEEWKKSIKDFFTVPIYIHSHMNLPFQLAYETPDTLGIDRLCNMAGVAHKEPKNPKLVVDMGTCIKFDFMNDKNVYEGGSIAPGLAMRSNALHSFTAKLPLVSLNTKAQLIGKNTQESLQSGVYLGWKAEIKEMIRCYEESYPSLKIYLCGGDVGHFDFEQKSNIFVLEHLTLEGILEIYRLNEHSF